MWLLPRTLRQFGGMVAKILNWAARGRIWLVMHSILVGVSASRDQGLLMVLGLPQARQDGCSQSMLGQGKQKECAHREVLKLHLWDAQ